VLSQTHTIRGVGVACNEKMYEAAMVTYLATGQSILNPKDIQFSYQATDCQNPMHNPSLRLCNRTDLKFDFISTDVIMTRDQYQAYPDLQMYPAVAEAVVLVYNIPDLDPSKTLVLTELIILLIYQGNITTWTDPQILELNDPVTQSKLNSLKDPAISVCVNSDSAGSSSIFKSALQRLSSSLNLGAFHFPTVGTDKKQNFFFASYNGISAHISSNINTIAYLLLGDALSLGLPMASLKRGNITISPTSSSIIYATSELGMSFGNNGDPAVHLTANLVNAKNDLAWPMVGYSYFVMRKKSLDPSESCQTRLELVNFWIWFLSSDTASLLIQRFGFCPLPAEARLLILERLKMDIMCQSQPVFQTKPIQPIRFALPYFFNSQLRYLFGASYTAISPSTSFALIDANSSSMDLFVANELDILVSRGPPFLSPTIIGNSRVYYATPFAATAFVFIYNVCENSVYCRVKRLTFDSTLISGIMSGGVQFWNETGFSDFSHVDEPIKLYAANTVVNDLSILQHAFYPSLLNTSFVYFTKIVVLLESELQVMLAVSGTPYSLGFIHYNQDIVENPMFVGNIKRSDGSIVSPSIDSIGACAQDTFNPAINKFTTLFSKNPDCYPLTQCYSIMTFKMFKDATCSSSSSPVLLANFLSWILKRGKVLRAFTSNMLFPLFAVNDMVYKHTQDQLNQITCNGVSILDIPCNYNYISTWASFLAWTVFSLVATIGTSFGIWIFRNRRNKIVNYSQPEFLVCIIMGAVIITYTLIPLSKDDKKVQYYNLDRDLNLDVPVPELDAACRSIPWIYLTGAAFEITAIFAKIWRLKMILLCKPMKKVKIKVIHVAPILLISLTFTWVVCGVWEKVSPLKWKRWATLFDSNGVMIASFARCDSSAFLIFYSTIFTCQVLALVFGMVLCYQTRNVQEEFVENKWITVILLNMMTTMLFTILLGYFMRHMPNALFAIALINVLMTGLVVLLLMIVPKIQMVLVKNDANNTILNNGPSVPLVPAAHLQGRRCHSQMYQIQSIVPTQEQNSYSGSGECNTLSHCERPSTSITVNFKQPVGESDPNFTIVDMEAK